MKHSFRFFQNRECRFFPCHPVQDPRRFNCLFCFCPLYLLHDCGGDYRMVKGVKDCSNCAKPHEPGYYDVVVDKLRREIERRKTEGGWKAPDGE